ncbi:MAG: hypothetical protein ABIG66_03740 [Candidatus Kerfeldbacteria bacterium]
MKLRAIAKEKEVSLYQGTNEGGVEQYVISTPETRDICNDPLVLGVDYTRKLQHATNRALKAMKEAKLIRSDEENAVVFHILRGGLNFNLRNALHDAFGWNRHNSGFISSQRAKDEKGGWYITENRYQKVHMPDNAHIFLGDVVATGTSLEHALLLLVDIATDQKKEIRQITFFTIGGARSGEIVNKVDKECRKRFPNYEGSQVVYVEGIFGVADEDSKLQIRLTGTDLLRSDAVLAPEFIESQKEKLSYALERCTIYDAGSRAFHIDEYLKDVLEYWKQVADLARKGTTLAAYLKERYPEDERLADAAWIKENDTPEKLLDVANRQIKLLDA